MSPDRSEEEIKTRNRHFPGGSDEIVGDKTVREKRSLCRSKQRKNLARRRAGVIRETGGAERVPFPKSRASGQWCHGKHWCWQLAGYRLLWHCSSSEVVAWSQEQWLEEKDFFF